MMRRAVANAIRNSSREWNKTHDRLRVLPVELPTTCWSYLPLLDIVRLAYVCSAWRDISRSSPCLWTTIRITGCLDEFDLILSRSAQLPLDLSVCVPSQDDMAYVDERLRRQAHRLRALHVISTEGLVLRDDGLFSYPAPVLEHLALKQFERYDDGHDVISPSIFNGHAPNLRSLALDEVPFPVFCPTFRSIGTLLIKWDRRARNADALKHLYTVAPDVKNLVLINVAHLDHLPLVPTYNNLRNVTLTCENPSFFKLRSCGYLRLPRLDVFAYEINILYKAGNYEAPSLRATLSVCYTGTAKMVLHDAALGATASFSSEHASREECIDLVRYSSNFAALQRLVLPSATRASAFGPPSGAVQYPYIEGELRLPALRTLAIAHGAGKGCSDCCLLDPAVVRGTIVAPLLSRIEIIRSEEDTDATAIKPGRLAQFIEAHIECGDRAALEVFIDPENPGLLDFADQNGMDQLRRCVAKIAH